MQIQPSPTLRIAEKIPRSVALAFLKGEPRENVFLISRILKSGMDNPRDPMHGVFLGVFDEHQSLRGLCFLGNRGTLVISGVEPPKRFEWTPLYFKELHVIGSNGFGVEEVRGVAKHAMEHYFDFVGGGFDLTPVITHRFPLERWDEAVLALKDSRRTGAVKVLLEPGG